MRSRLSVEAWDEWAGSSHAKSGKSGATKAEVTWRQGEEVTGKAGGEGGAEGYM